MPHAPQCGANALIGGLLLAALVVGCATSSQSVSSTSTDPVTLFLTAPSDPEQRAYLGLPQETDQFLIGQVKTDVLIIDCFDLYCPSCQKGAKYVNQLYDLIEERGLAGQVKLIGLGLGDTPMEVAAFRDKYAVRFPVFPDRSNAIARQFGEVRVPGLVIIRPGNEMKVLHREPGVVRDPAKLLEHVLEDLARGTALPRTSVPGATPEECDAELCPITI